jgi:hypothetical protein
VVVPFHVEPRGTTFGPGSRLSSMATRFPGRCPLARSGLRPRGQGGGLDGPRRRDATTCAPRPRGASGSGRRTASSLRTSSRSRICGSGSRCSGARARRRASP